MNQSDGDMQMGDFFQMVWRGIKYGWQWVRGTVRDVFFRKGRLEEWIVAVLVCVYADRIWKVWIGWCGDWIDKVYDTVSGLTVLLWFAAGYAAWLAYREIRFFWKYDVPFWAYPAGIAAIWLICSWSGEYVELIGGLSAKTVLLTLTVIPLAMPLLRHDIEWWMESSEDPESVEVGLYVDHPDYVKDGRKDYAAALASLIRNTDISKRGLTVGISGEWGAGKTLVLREFRKELEKSLTVIEFSPWKSTSPDSLIEDFFTTLASHLHKYSRSLGQHLVDYSSKLIELDLHKKVTLLAKIGRMAGGGYLSVNAAYDKVEKDLESLSRKIVVIIDDLDRLDKDELFETLRLVRNTAHFKNIAYILAYDPVYTARMLERKGIENAEVYLHKIFMVSLSLPVYENYTYVSVINSILEKNLGNDSESVVRLGALVEYRHNGLSESFINRFISNYRQAVQFGTFLSTNFLLLKKMNPTYGADFNLEEWYRLQLLQFFYPEVYKKLRMDPEIFLSSDRSWGALAFGYADDKCALFANENPSQKQALEIIKLIFQRSSRKLTSNSIGHQRNFYNYFASRVLSTEISESEFRDMLSGKRPNSLILTDWLQRKPSVQESVDSYFHNHNIGDLAEDQTKRLITGLLWWHLLTQSKSSLKTIKELTHHSDPKGRCKQATESYKDTILSILGNPETNPLVITKLITVQTPYPIIPGVPLEAQEQAYPLVDENEAEDLFERLLRREMDAGRIKSVDDLFDEKAVLYGIISEAYRYVDADDDHNLLYKNYALNPLRKIFEEMINSDPGKKGRNFNQVEKMFSFVRTEDDQQNADNYDQTYHEMQSMFETCSNFYDFIDRYFEGTAIRKLTVKRLTFGIH